MSDDSGSEPPEGGRASTDPRPGGPPPWAVRGGGAPATPAPQLDPADPRAAGPTPSPPPQPPRLRPLAVGEILDGAMKVWRTDLRKLFPWVALFALPAQILVALLRLSLPNGAKGLTTTGQFGETAIDGEALRTFIGGTVVIVAITLLSTLIITAALTAYLTDRVLDRPTDLRACLRVGWSQLLPLIGAGLLVGLGVFFGVLACIVPGLILWIRWNFASQIVVVERARPVAAIKRSFWLTEGRFWPILGILLISGILAGIVSSVFSGILNAVVVAVTEADSVASAATGLITGTIASGLTLPFSAAVSVITYLDLRVRREGLDLQLLAHGITSEP